MFSFVSGVYDLTKYPGNFRIQQLFSGIVDYVLSRSFRLG